MPKRTEVTSNEQKLAARRVRLGWASAWVFALLTLAAFLYAAWRNATNPPGVDFAGFWAAGRMVVKGTPALAYDVAAHASLALAGGVRGLLPFPYPPAFLFILAPFGLAPFPLAFILWVLATTAFYLLATRRAVELPYGLALPAAMSNVLVGQTGFLLSGIFVAAAEILESSPWVAGCLFGLLAIKPQMALLIPIALAAGNHWKAFAGAALSVIGLAAAAAICFGAGTYRACVQSMGYLTQLMSQTSWPWHKLSSVLAFARFFGVPEGLAFAIQGIAAVAAALITWRAWRRRNPARVPVLAAATILVPPYLFTYDALLLVVPFGWFIRNDRPLAAAILWLCCLPPVLGYVAFYNGPNTIPLAAAFALSGLMRERPSAVPQAL